jgi:hypothetical protein
MRVRRIDARSGFGDRGQIIAFSQWLTENSLFVEDLLSAYVCQRAERDLLMTGC